MKLLFVTDKIGERVYIRLADQSFFFAGRQPEPDIVIALELPGVSSGSAEDIVNWLQQEAAKKAGQSSAAPPDQRALIELPEHVWRRATIDDFIDGRNWNVFKRFGYFFTLDEFVAFLDRWYPRMMKQLHRALPDRDVHKPRMSGIPETLRRVAPIRTSDDYRRSTKRISSLRSCVKSLLNCPKLSCQRSTRLSSEESVSWSMPCGRADSMRPDGSR